MKASMKAAAQLVNARGRQADIREARKVVRLVCISVEQLLETHRWTRRIEERGARRSYEELFCLDCGAVITWDPKRENEPTIKSIARCPGKVVMKAKELNGFKPFGLEVSAGSVPPVPELSTSSPANAVEKPGTSSPRVPCNAGHDSGVECEYCLPPATKEKRGEYLLRRAQAQFSGCAEGCRLKVGHRGGCRIVEDEPT